VSARITVRRPGPKALNDPYANKPNVRQSANERVGGGASNTEAAKHVRRRMLSRSMLRSAAVG
jgi:predicted phage gp36 major capsid-like protein